MVLVNELPTLWVNLMEKLSAKSVAAYYVKRFSDIES